MVRDFWDRLLTGVLVEQRNIEFLIFWLKRPCKSHVLRFFLKISFFVGKTSQIDDFGRFFLVVGRTAVRLLSNFWGLFFVIFSRYTLENRVFEVTVYNIFLTHASTLRTLISYFDSRKKSTICKVLRQI